MNYLRKVFVLLIGILFVLNAHSLLAQNLKSLEENREQPPYDLLIIAPEVFTSLLSPLVMHKNTNDVKTRLVSIEEVYDQMYWQGRDDAEKLKYFIKEAIEQWGITYVLLVGGRKDQGIQETWWVPVRYSHLDRNYDQWEEHQFLTDLYFADIYDDQGNFSSWDTDNDGVFGEWPKNMSAEDILDLYPDVVVGRLPCRNRWDVFVMVQKIISYESTPCDDSWFKNMVVVAGDTYPDKTPYFDGEVYTQMGLDMMPGFTPVKLWTSDGSFSSWRDVVRAINRGCGFLWLSGHGNPSSWSTHPPNDNETWIHGLKLREMPFLLNGKKQPICITGSGCFNSMFNVSYLHGPWVYSIPIPRCFSWGLTCKLFGGAIATIGATAFSYESPDINLGYGGIEWLDMHFFGEYGLNHTDILGETWGNTVSSFLDHFPIDWDDQTATGSALVVKNLQEWLLIGDPSLKIGGYS